MNINLNTVPSDVLSVITNHLDVRSITRLPLIAKAFASVAIDFFQRNDMARNQLFISRINRCTADQVKLQDVFKLVNKGLRVDSRLIFQCEEMYGITRAMKSLLENHSTSMIL